MDKEDFLIQQHMNYAESFVKASTAFGTEFYHPKTNRRITLSMKQSLIRDHFRKTVDKIMKVRSAFMKP